MKTLLPALSLALLLAACGSTDTESNAAKAAPQAMRSQAAVHAAAEYAQLTQNLYIGFFGRPADAAGLAYWSQIFSDKNLPLTFPEWVTGYTTNADIKSILDTLVGSQEAQELYVSNNASFINAIYQNGFNRYSEASGREFWAGLIDRGVITRAQAVLSILSSAGSGDADILARKTQAATIFTSLLTSDTRRLTYGTGGYSDAARDLLGRITGSTDISVFRAALERFAAELDMADGGVLVVRRYLGYHYLQNMTNEPLYAAGYRYLDGVYPYLPTAGSLTYGAEPQVTSWTRNDAAGYVYGAPVTASLTLVSNNRLPAMSMLCSPVAGVTKSTDVLVARNAYRLVDAAQLANQRFTVYRENCAQGGSNLSSFTFDAAGNGSFPLPTGGVMSIDAAGITNILRGEVQFDLSTGKFLVFAAFGYTRTDGNTGYFIVQHLGNHKTGVTDGVLAVWAQE